MLNQKLKNYNIILASTSPRRQEFLKTLDIDFKIKLKPVEEVYPKELKQAEISDYLSVLKAKPFLNELSKNDILITSDTIVWHEQKALGKPKNKHEAFEMLQSMSGKTHEVITSVCLTSKAKQIVINDTTKVTFKDFTEEELWYYIDNYNPFDKAGAYGIQEWIGQIGVTNLEGSYFNVMGFPVHKVYKTLINNFN
ncbi:MAG: septum formation protein Maf [Flavobacteriaceae bacterium]|nr:septum formation protein Maf [Flavobacteriaceae bacterium]